MQRTLLLAGLTASAILAQNSTPVAYAYLLELCDGFGPRLTGSPGERAARQWAAAKMTKIGLENVHEEKFLFPRAWTRGHARAALVAPLKMDLAIHSLGWAGSTRKGGIEAEVVQVNRNQLAREAKRLGQLRGKAVFLASEGEGDQLRTFAEMGGFLDEAVRAGVAAVITGDDPGPNSPASLTRVDSAHMTRDFTPIPVVAMVPEHRAILGRLLASGAKPRLRIDVRNEISKGSVETANVMGEIRGGKRPDEIVLVGAHLDSWDLGQGATDDGFGAAAVLAAADEIRKTGVKPLRTIRFVLFSGEEQGIKGSRAYVARHAAGIGNHVAALMSDMGSGPPAGLLLNGRADLQPAIKEAIGALGLTKFRVSNDPFIAGDSMPFILAGVPALDTMQDSRNFSQTHHTMADTVDKVKPEDIARQSQFLAAFAAWIANRETRIGPVRDAMQTKEMISKLGIGSVLEIMGLGDRR